MRRQKKPQQLSGTLPLKFRRTPGPGNVNAQDETVTIELLDKIPDKGMPAWTYRVQGKDYHYSAGRLMGLTAEGVLNLYYMNMEFIAGPYTYEAL